MPVQSGLRVVLAYNLVRTGPRKGVNTLGLSAEHMEGLAAAVRAWEEAPSAEARGHLLALPLEHKYTETNLSFGGLKGRDHTRVQALLGCGLLEVRLGLLHKHVSLAWLGPGPAAASTGDCARAACPRRACTAACIGTAFGGRRAA
ncbi:hypothetical protein HYH03_002784 [Edaphochlamys debaryana]|uniref:Uncharacterized protein n=1 Tax=Edaphochlamys debaryana TaxID=47281 RepID=A0A835YAP3_9CHLO|nr:hypothetical protein HYH03_002784 [Edaphochlamys debaryana]|eukprot:KAG2499203.1 hypothetical protein HYH03_002784 [Edaphochlamys debaryana]